MVGAGQGQSLACMPTFSCKKARKGMLSTCFLPPTSYPLPCPGAPPVKLQEESWEEEEDEEEEDASSDDEERHTLWDPSLATPARGLKARKAAAAAAGGEGRMQRRRSSAASGSGGLLPEEQPVVAHLNEQLRRQGKEPVFKPTVRAGAGKRGKRWSVAFGQYSFTQHAGVDSAVIAPLAALPVPHAMFWHQHKASPAAHAVSLPRRQVALMKEVLKDQVIGGRRWRLGAKKREDLVRDYRWADKRCCMPFVCQAACPCSMWAGVGCVAAALQQPPNASKALPAPHNNPGLRCSALQADAGSAAQRG